MKAIELYTLSGSVVQYLNKYISIKLLKKKSDAATVFLNTPHQGAFSVSRSHTFCPHFLKIHRALSETLLSQNFDLEECRSPKPDGCRSLCVLYFFFDFKSLHPCPKDRMSLVPPQFCCCC